MSSTGSTRRTCRVVSIRDVTSQVEFWLNRAQASRSADCDDAGEALQSLLWITVAGSSWSAVAASLPNASVSRYSALENRNDESDAGEFMSSHMMKRLHQQSSPDQQQRGSSSSLQQY